MISNSRGFTLIEVLVAVAILAGLSYYTAQSIQKAVQSKVKIQGDIERTSNLRGAMRIIERDINRAFNYRDPNIELYNKAGKERERRAQQPKDPAQPGETETGTADPSNPDPAGGAANPTEPKEPFKPKPLVILTHFEGDGESLHFTSLNHFRTQQDAKESNQMEVGYFLRSCRNRVDPSQSSQCLFRRTSPILDDDVTQSDQDEEIALLENVTRFELRYLGYQENADWQSSWSSKEAPDDITKDHFPLAVEVTLETRKGGEKSKPTAMTIVAEIRNPNNPIPEQPDPAAGGASVR